jgi:hypothetical protein
MGRRPCLGATDDAVGGALVALVRATAREAAREVAGAGCSRLGRRPEEGGRPTTNDWDAGGGGGARQGLAMGSDEEGQRSGAAAQEAGAWAGSGADPPRGRCGPGGPGLSPGRHGVVRPSTASARVLAAPARA